MSAYYDNIEAAATLLSVVKMLAKVKLTVLKKKLRKRWPTGAVPSRAEHLRYLGSNSKENYMKPNFIKLPIPPHSSDIMSSISFISLSLIRILGLEIKGKIKI